MTDRYERIRDALAMGPTPGPFFVANGSDVFTALGSPNAQGTHSDEDDGWHVADCLVGATFVNGEEMSLTYREAKANAHLFAACDPDTIRGLLAEHDALQAECERLRTCLAETAGVAVTMLYESHKADTIKEFTVEQLSQMVETTKHLADANIQVEKVYRKAWDMAQGCAGDDWGGVQ